MSAGGFQPKRFVLPPPEENTLLIKFLRFHSHGMPLYIVLSHSGPAHATYLQCRGDGPS